MRAPRLRCGWPVLLAPLLLACGTPNLPSALKTPARLSEAGAAARQELRVTLARMLGAPDVMIADDAFLGESVLIIDKARGRDPRGLPLSGRDYDKPEQFRLVRLGESCTLIRVRTGERAALPQTRCKAGP